MRIGICLAIELFLVATLAQAQPCPPVRFRDTPQANTAFRSPRLGGLGLIRQADGSFQARTYYRVGLGLSPSSVEVGPVIEGFEAEIYRCSGFPAPQHMANPDVIPFSETQLGISAQPVIFADLTGKGLITSAGIDRRSAPDAVIITMLNAAFELDQAAVAYPTGTNPRGVIAGDFNGDDSIDLAVTFNGPFDRSSPGGVSVLFNDGDGAFGSAINTSLGNFISTATAWDWNDDGDLDLAVSQSPSELLFLAGNGDGTFDAPENLGEGGSNLAAFDVTEDGRGDLLVVGASEGFVYYPATAGGGFGARVTTGVVGGFFTITAGDFNDDGRGDVALGNLAVDQVGVSLNTGGGAFAPPVIHQAGRNPETLMVTDFDGDGNQDVVIANGHPHVLASNIGWPIIAALRGRGDGSFIGRPVLGAQQGATGVAIADFDNDTFPDVAVSSDDGPVAVFPGDGGGAFGDPILTASTRGRLRTIGSGEFDGNANTDVVVADSGWVAVMTGNGDGTFDAPKSRTGPQSPIHLVVADFDGGGRDDVAVASSSAVQVFISNPDGTLASAGTVAVPLPINISDLQAGDVNKDGRADLLVTDGGSPGRVHILLATGGGMFGSASSITVGNGARGVLPIDFSGDGDLDLAVTADGDNFTWNVVYFNGDGAGGFSEVGTTPTEFGPGRMAHADLNSDDSGDLIVLHCCGSTDPAFLLSDGAGSFQPEVPFFAGPDPARIQVADFNRDGRPDLAILSNANATDNGVTILINESDTAGPVHVSAASFAAGPVAPGMLITAFGAGIADREETATSTPLPTELAGTRIAVWDSANERRESQLIFINPTQANYFLDPQTRLGPALISVEPAQGSPLTTQVQVERIAPGLFFLNGDFLAAAQILRVRASGEQVLEPVFEFNDQGALVARAIDFGPPDDRLFLVLFGTGFRRHAGLGQVRIFVNGIEHAALFAGDQGTFAGLDQANAELNRALAGSGDVEIRLEVEGKITNIVRLTFR